MEINITAWKHHLGATSPDTLTAWISKEKIFNNNDVVVKVLRLYLGGEATIRIWPADPEKIGILGEKLIQISKDLSRKEK